MTHSDAPLLYLIRHGETEWSKSGQHTGRTDIPLTDKGRTQAKEMAALISKIKFSLVLTSPLSRAHETAKLIGLGDQAKVCDDLAEVNYGAYEGKTTIQIRESTPGWTVWTHPCPDGETLVDVEQRARNVINKALSAGGKIALFSHGHMLRILTAVYLGMPASEGRHFMLDTCTLSILSMERESRTIKMWNSPANLVAALV